MWFDKHDERDAQGAGSGFSVERSARTCRRDGKKTMKTKQPTGKRNDRRQVRAVVLWSVTLCDGDWYWVFAVGAEEAVQIVIAAHYDTFTRQRFQRQYAPTVRRIEDDERLVVNEEHGQKTATAGEWRIGQDAGPFVSNTYEI